MTIDQLPPNATHFAAYASAGRTPKALNYPAVSVANYPAVLERCEEEGRSLVILGPVPTPPPKPPRAKVRIQQQNPARNNGRGKLPPVDSAAPKTGKHILCITTGEVYPTATAVARAFESTPVIISRHLNNPSAYAQVKGKRFRYATAAEIVKAKM